MKTLYSADTEPNAAHAATDIGAVNDRTRRALTVVRNGPAILFAAGAFGLAALCLMLGVHLGCSL